MGALNSYASKLKRLNAKAQWHGDDICGALMGAFGIKRNPDNYLTIIALLHKYRARIQKGRHATPRTDGT
jgi:hypothetical protein